jgi:F-type H+-transporting ATPase subunit delta
VRQSIRGYADGLIDRAPASGDGSLSALASELSALGGTVGGSDDLRRALSDPGIPVSARRGIIHDLFENRVGKVTLRLVDFVLGVDRASEVVPDIEWLVERFDAAVRSMAPVGDVVLGIKGAEERVEGYASAVLSAAPSRKELSDLEDELFRFSRIVAGAHDLRHALSDRDLPTANRRQIVLDLLEGKASPVATSLASYLTKIGRPRDFEALLGTIIDRVASESNRRLADVRSAVALDDQQQTRLAEALSRAVGHDVEVRVSVDPSVVGGFVATIGDTVVDGSARHQLEILRERLVSPETGIGITNITTGERH